MSSQAASDALVTPRQVPAGTWRGVARASLVAWLDNMFLLPSKIGRYPID